MKCWRTTSSPNVGASSSRSPPATPATSLARLMETVHRHHPNPSIGFNSPTQKCFQSLDSHPSASPHCCDGFPSPTLSPLCPGLPRSPAGPG